MSDSVKVQFKKPKRIQARVSVPSSDDEENEKGSEIFKREKRSKSHLVQSSSSGRKRRKKVGGSSSSSSDDEREGGSGGGEKVSVSFKGTGEMEENGGVSGGDATRALETETPEDRDHRAIFERSREINAELKAGTNILEDKTYRGLNNYAKFIEKRDSAAGSAAKMSASGPKRAPTNVRSTVRWDYAPDICKDFKETGFCGFGDSCKFMHDRSDYKFGWQLERDMASGKYEEEDDAKYEVSSDEEDLPFKCFYCKGSFISPVITKCKHYFCEKCALAHYRRSQRCFACGKQTNGVFNPAKELIAKLDSLKDQSPDNEEEAEERKAFENDDDEEKTVEKYKSDADESSEEEVEIPGDTDTGIDNEDIDDNLQPESSEFNPVEIQNELNDE